VPQMSLKDRLSSSNRIAIITLGSILLAFYAAVIADYYARPPSPGRSREVEIARTEWLTSGTVRNHVLSLDSPDGTRETILFDDGHQTRIVDIDVYGNTIADETYPLDLTEARRISAYYRNPGRITLVGHDGSLFEADIDRRSGEVVRRLLVPDVDGFLADGSLVVLERAGGLYGRDVGEAAPGDSGGVTASGSDTLIVSGRILDYAMDVAGDSVWIAAVVGASGSRYEQHGARRLPQKTRQ